jgi:hypothetical protein
MLLHCSNCVSSEVAMLQLDRHCYCNIAYAVLLCGCCCFAALILHVPGSLLLLADVLSSLCARLLDSMFDVSCHQFYHKRTLSTLSTLSAWNKNLSGSRAQRVKFPASLVLQHVQMHCAFSHAWPARLFGL